MENSKPPLGLKPRWLAAQHRAVEIQAAIGRYEKAQLDVPEEWRTELKELNDWLYANNYSQVT